MERNDVIAEDIDDVTAEDIDDVTRNESDRRTSDIIEHCLDVAKIDASQNVFIMPHD